MSATTGGQFGLALMDGIMARGGVVRQRFVPPHAGGAPRTLHVGSPMVETIHSAAAADNFLVAPVPAQQVQETGSSRKWLQGPLRECARNPGDDGALARSLLDAGAATDVADRTGRSPLHWACTRGNTAVALALLDAGADGSARDGTGKTPLHCAAQVGHTSVVVALLDFYGFVPRGGSPPPAMPALPGTAAAEKALPSLAAARQHESAVASIVDARNAYGSTALHRAAFNGREGVVVALLSGGADVSVAGKSGRTALHLACHNAHAGCVGILLAWGADDSARANDGTTPWKELALTAEARPPGCPRVAKAAFFLNAARSTRAWGRRGWLVMLKDRHSRYMAGQTVEAERVAAAAADDDDAVMLPREEQPGRAPEMFSEDDREASEESGARGDLVGLVGGLLAVAEVGCFRMVIGFL